MTPPPADSYIGTFDSATWLAKIHLPLTQAALHLVVLSDMIRKSVMGSIEFTHRSGQSLANTLVHVVDWGARCDLKGECADQDDR